MKKYKMYYLKREKVDGVGCFWMVTTDETDDRICVLRFPTFRQAYQHIEKWGGQR